jgi:hypothetical protein
MEFDKIEILLEKYFESETSIAEEKELRRYFTSQDVAPQLKQYQSLFAYFSVANDKKQEGGVSFQVVKQKRVWLSIAASVVVLLSIGTYAYFDSNLVNKSTELGTYNDPEEAFVATQKALAMLSNHVNVGVESVQYIQIYEDTKNKAFVE